MVTSFGRPRAPSQRGVVAGIGFSSHATVDEIVELISACLAEAGLSAGGLVAIATHVRKAASPLAIQVALQFAVPLRLLADDELSMPGVAEAVARAAGPLRLGKRKSRYATCALALCAPDFSLSAFGQPSSLSAAMAASIELTSSAGP